MPTCQICQHSFKGGLKFNTPHISICVRCVNTLNGNPAPAIHAERELAEMLHRGILRRAATDASSTEAWIREKAQRTLRNPEAEVDRALPGWLNKLLGDKSNGTRPFKIMRAYRRGLVRYETGNPYDYPSDWREKARGIRSRDNDTCVTCGRMAPGFDVHHIVYLSNLGTNRQENLVTLCRQCHEEEHGRTFDLPESKDPEQDRPIQPKNAAPLVQPKPLIERPEANPHHAPPSSAEVSREAQPTLAKRITPTCRTCGSKLVLVRTAPDKVERTKCPSCIARLVPSHQPITPSPPDFADTLPMARNIAATDDSTNPHDTSSKVVPIGVKLVALAPWMFLLVMFAVVIAYA